MKAFILCSHLKNIPSQYFFVAENVAQICINKKYSLVFGAILDGLMGKVYNKYQKSNLDIYACAVKGIFSNIDKIPNKYNKVSVNTLEEQLSYFLESDIFIALPGGYGTLYELIYLIQNKALGLHNKRIIIVNEYGFYDELLKFIKKLSFEKFIEKSNRNLVTVINNYKDLEKLI